MRDMENNVKALIPLKKLNQMAERAAVSLLEPVFELSPWVASAVICKRPFRNVKELHKAMMDIVLASPKESILQFLCSHPELAGKEMSEGNLTEDSSKEQSSAGLDSLTSDELMSLHVMNKNYRDKHGFPFIICVRRYTKYEIFQELARRTGNFTEEEFSTALEHIAIITLLRLESLVCDA